MHTHCAYLYKWDVGPYTHDCCRGTVEEQTEKQEDTTEGQEVETTSGRPRRADWHS